MKLSPDDTHRHETIDTRHARAAEQVRHARAQAANDCLHLTRRKSLNSWWSLNTGGVGRGGPNSGTDSSENTFNLQATTATKNLLNLHDMIISYTSTNDVGISVSIWLISAQQNVFGYCAMTSHRPSHHIRHGRITQGYWIWKLLAQNVLENIFRIVCRSASLLACM